MKRQSPLRLTPIVHFQLLSLFLATHAWAQSVPPERRIRFREQSLHVYEPFSAEEMWKRIEIPPSPALRPQETIKSFQVMPGFVIECVAAEPLVEDPVMFEFDPDGRIWVVELRGYMADIDGSTEGDPIGRVVVLEDTDGDTLMDKSTVFLDGLVMARTISFVQGGVLVQEPPNLWYCQDTDGDLKCDKKRLVGKLGLPGDPQHTDNGLFHSIDNWMYNAKSSVRHKFIDGKLIEEETFFRGQWGMSQDDYGRLHYCYESSPLHADLVPSMYMYRNKNFQHAIGGGRLSYGLNAGIYYGSQEIHPIRVAPGITLGGRELREDGTLRTFTVVAGISIYRGDQFPPEYYGCAVIPESGGNLVRLNRLTNNGINIGVKNFYDDVKKEWVASTDERFRPVNSRTGPDGAVYVCDMYKGIIEHVVFLMPYLRHQIEARGLELPPGMGRIYRIRYTGNPLGQVPKMSQHSRAQLVGHLSHPNGWWRDTAQRLLVEAKAVDQTDALRHLATNCEKPLGRLHALWTLEGVGRLDWATIDDAIGDDDAMVRATAIRLSERFIKDTHKVLPRISKVFSDQRPMVRLQLLCTLGAFRGDHVEAMMADIVSAHRNSTFFAVATSGLEGRELELMERILEHPEWQRDWKRVASGESLLALVSMAVFNEQDPTRVGRLLDLIAQQGPAQHWRRDSMLKGIVGSHLSRRRWPEPLELPSRPSILDSLAPSDNQSIRKLGEQLLHIITWPGDTTQRETRPIVRPMSAEEQERYTLGRAIYAVTCHACHHENGHGQAGKAPPLVESPWVVGPPDRLARIALHGVTGTIEVNGKKWNLTMPGLGHSPMMTDDRLAAVLTYVRRAWDNWGDPVDTRFIANVRKQTAGRTAPWVAEELLNLDPTAPPSSETTVQPTDPLADYRDALEGGDAERGRRLFHTNLKLRCSACHQVGTQGGGFVGPDLSEVGTRAKREDLLESLIDPSAKIVKGYDTMVIITNDGKPLSGVFVSDDGEHVVLHPPTGGTVTVPVDEIDQRILSPISSMPPVGKLFSNQEASDLIEYLSTLKKAK